MSQEALNNAVKDRLQAHFDWDDTKCDVMEDGRPKPAAGELFVAISESPGQSLADDSLDEYYGVLVTVTQRVGFEPFDRLGPNVVNQAKNGLLALGAAIKVVIHSDYVVMNKANDYIEQTIVGNATVYGFSEPLRFKGPPKVEEKSGAWFHADPQSVEVGLALSLNFARARRLQSIALMA